MVYSYPYVKKVVFAFVTVFLTVTTIYAQELSKSDSISLKSYQTKLNYFEGNDFDSTLFYLNKLEKLSLAPEVRVKVNLDLGNMFLFKGELHFATEYYLKVKAYGQETNNILFETAGNISLAIVYIREEKFDKANELLKEAELSLDKYSPKNNLESSYKVNFLISIYTNRALVLTEQQEYGSALKYVNNSIKLSDSINDTYNLAIAYSDKAEIYQKSGKMSEAIILHYKALDLRIKDDLLIDITRSQNNLGEAYFEMGNTDSAFYYLEKGFNNAVQLDLVFDIYNSADLLSKLYFKQEDYKNAFKYLEISSQNKQKYQDLEKRNIVTDLNNQYNINRIKIEQEIREKQLFSAIIGLTLIVFIVFLLYVLQRKASESSKREKEKLMLSNRLIEDQLEHKNKQLVTTTMSQISRNELMLQISNQLKVLSESLNQKQKLVLNNVIKELRKGNDNSVLGEFEHAFQDVHTQFYEKLDRLYSLTPSERRMAAFIKLNLSTKEISAITNQSVRTIDVTRYRLRKKLNISNTSTNLSSFLSKL